jgi:ribonuclease J
MPDCVALAFTSAGVVLPHQDFGVDQTPLDAQPVDVPPPRALGTEGVLVLLGDSTNVERKGFSGSERDVEDGFEEIFTSARGRIVIAMFASSLYRMQIVVDLADQFDRKVAFVGRGVIENSEIARRLGYLRVPPDSRQRTPRIPLAGRRLHLHGVAGRAAGRAAADRDRRSPAREDRSG